MKYKILGHSGLRVSELCLGAMTFGEESGFGAPEAACREIFDAFLDAGGNFVDTANIYSGGTSEKMLAGFIADQRDYLVVASKYAMNTRPDDPNAGGAHRKNLVQALDASLKRLDTDYLDLFWVHGWDRFTDIRAMMRALDDQVRAGKIMHIGISNAPSWVIALANSYAQENGLTPFCSMQLHYNLVERGLEADYFDLADTFDMVITAWSPLAGGLLTGKFNPDRDAADSEGTRLKETYWGQRLLQEQMVAIAAKLTERAEKIGCSPAQLALAWLMQRPQGTVIPIIGARKPHQFTDNLACLDVELSDEDIAALDLLDPPVYGYPHNLLSNPMFAQMLLGPVSEHIEA